MKYIVIKGNSLHFQRNFPRRLQATTGTAFYKRLQLNKDAHIEVIERAWQACQDEYEYLCKTAERTGTAPAILQKRQQIDDTLTLSQFWLDYLAFKNFNDKTAQNANNDWARFYRNSGNLECHNDNLSIQLINNALINHVNLRAPLVKPSTIKRELSLIVAALNYGASKHGMFWRVNSPKLPAHKASSKADLSTKALKLLFKHAGDDTSCTDVDTVLLLALLNITPAQISRIRPKDINGEGILTLNLRDQYDHINRKLPIPFKQQFIRYSLDGAINLCKMSKGYVSRICAERLREITNSNDASLASLNTTFKRALETQTTTDACKLYLLKGGKKTKEDIETVLLNLFEQYL